MRLPAHVKLLGHVWNHHFQAHTERLFLASVAFFLTFGVVRAITHLIRADVGPFHDVVASGGLHIHHLVWGILILLLVGYLWLGQVGTGEDGKKWLSRFTAILFGAGAALTLDEFAIWLFLNGDVYWQRQGRDSVDAVILFGGLLAVGLWGAPFVHAVVREIRSPD
jgi:hypothetical protein